MGLGLNCLQAESLATVACLVRGALLLTCCDGLWQQPFGFRFSLLNAPFRNVMQDIICRFSFRGSVVWLERQQHIGGCLSCGWDGHRRTSCMLGHTPPHIHFCISFSIRPAPKWIPETTYMSAWVDVCGKKTLRNCVCSVEVGVKREGEKSHELSTECLSNLAVLHCVCSVEVGVKREGEKSRELSTVSVQPARAVSMSARAVALRLRCWGIFL
jgi:hypothetical protein